MSRQRPAVAVIGGGPAGCATAIALAQAGVEDVVLVDATLQPPLRPCRTSPHGASPPPGAGVSDTRPPSSDRFTIGESIPPAATPLLRSLGVLDRVTSAGHRECPGSRSLWGSSEIGCNDFFLDPVGRGYHLDRAVFNEQLREAVAARGVEVRAGARFTHARAAGGGFELRLESGDGGGVLAASFVVDATGVRGSFTRRLAIARNVVDRLVCSCAFADAPAGALGSDHTLLEAVEHGWWYAARLPRGRAIVMLASDPETVRTRSFADPEGWRAALSGTELIGAEVADVAFPGGLDLITRAAPVMILSGVVGDRWLAVGDAASAYDPIGAAGITRALAHGIAAGPAIAGRMRGDGGAMLGRYQDRVFADFTDHVRLRATLYAAETRWANSPFWARRVRATTRAATV